MVVFVQPGWSHVSPTDSCSIQYAAYGLGTDGMRL